VNSSSGVATSVSKLLYLLLYLLYFVVDCLAKLCTVNTDLRLKKYLITRPTCTLICLNKLCMYVNRLMGLNFKTKTMPLLSYIVLITFEAASKQ